MQAESSTHDMPRGDGSRLLADFDDELNCEAENQVKPTCDKAPRMLTPDHCRGLTTKNMYRSVPPPGAAAVAGATEIAT